MFHSAPVHTRHPLQPATLRSRLQQGGHLPGFRHLSQPARRGFRFPPHPLRDFDRSCLRPLSKRTVGLVVTDRRAEIFLPSYANFDFDDLERKQDPVQEIVVTDEEIAKMFPS